MLTRKSLKSLLWTSLLLAAMSVHIYPDSLWNNSRIPLYSPTPRQIRVGDAITIIISETTSAVQEATTRTSKESSIGADFLSGWDQVANLLGNETIRKTYEFELAGDDRYAGAGQTTRRSRVESTVTALVTEVLDTGNLFVVGEHKVKVNNEVETIRISGIVRPEDISPANTVLSNQIAKAEVSVNGAGVVGQKQTPGILTKMFNWLF